MYNFKTFIIQMVENGPLITETGYSIAHIMINKYGTHEYPEPYMTIIVPEN